MDNANTMRILRLTARKEKIGAATSNAEILSIGHNNA
jgi:hypothetical protein